MSAHPFLALVSLVVLLGVVGAALFLRYIPNNRVGIVEKLVSGRGSVKTGLIALKGEAGFQPHLLRGGWHVLSRLSHRVHRVPLVTIPQGKIGYVFARDGAPLLPTQTLAALGKAPDFQDASAFLFGGGQRGPQRMVLREGTWAINLALFAVITESGVLQLPLDRQDEELLRRMAQLIAERQGFTPVVIKGTDDLVGIVTVHDGPSLPEGEIIAPVLGDDPADRTTYHNKFQDPERFLAAGGLRGRQLQVLVEGTYYLNRLFTTVELIHKTVVEVGHVGVVVSYTGAVGKDLSGDGYRHGELVKNGERGVWSEPLLPGKYAFNTYAGRVVTVPTTNIILKWIKNETGSHRLDENLSEIGLITKDAFEPTLPLSVVIHIDYRKAPLVIQRFGDIKRLVEQTLDPMVSAYFKNVGQTRTLLQLIQDRSAIQDAASREMKEKFLRYNLELEEVLIGTPGAAPGSSIEQILVQLRARQVAEEQVETYTRQEKAAVKERELREAEARAKQQSLLTESEVSITVQGNQGRAEYQRSLQQAAQIQALADAEGKKVRLLADAEAARIQAVGQAEADRAARVGVAQ
ncbi:MAG: SPFH domain-containing protein, partial [Thermoanaerobaculia bacterium]